VALRVVSEKAITLKCCRAARPRIGCINHLKSTIVHVVGVRPSFFALRDQVPASGSYSKRPLPDFAKS
jgi:hypothetical protein